MKIGDLLTTEKPHQVKGLFLKKCWFTDVVDESLLAGRKFYKPKSFQPSWVQDCDRANEYFILGVETALPSLQGIQRMDAGSSGHAKWIDYFKKAGLLRNDDFKFPLERFNPHLRARPDAIISFFDVEYYLVEIKFMGDDYFMELTDARNYHMQQWQFYSEMSGVYIGCLFYCSFNPNRKPKIFELYYDKEYVEHWYDKLRRVEKAVHDKMILPRTCSKQSEQYRYCSYKKYCYSEEGNKFG